MNLEELKGMWERDSKISDSNLSGESLNIPQLHSKYLNMLVDAKAKLMKRKYDLNILVRLKTRYYNGELTKTELEENGWDQWQFNKPLKSEMATILDADQDIIQRKLKIEYLEVMIFFLDSVMMSLKGRSFDIKNAISWNQYLAGN